MTEQEIMNLSGDELDFAVAVANGWYLSEDNNWWLSSHAKRGELLVIHYHPLTNSKQIIEIMTRELISVMPCAPNLWESEIVVNDKFISATGKTINEAVLRCYLLSKQGDNNVS